MVAVWKDLGRMVTTNVSSATLSIFGKERRGATDGKARMARRLTARSGPPTRRTVRCQWWSSRPTCAAPTG